MSFLNIENLNKSYNDNVILKDINFCMNKGEISVIVGESGCGKTTLLRILAGLDVANSGKILLDEKNIIDVEPGKRNIGMVFQKYSLFPNMTVYENVAYGLQIKEISKEEIKSKTYDILKKIRMIEKKDYYPMQLSGGQQQRVAFARSMVVEPKLILLDEPFSSLDMELRRELCEELKRIQKECNMTAIFVTHDIEEAMIMADTIHIIHNGIIEQSGEPKEIYFHPNTIYVASIVGECNRFDANVFSKIVNCNINSKYVVIRNENIVLSEKEISDGEKISIPVEVSDIVFCGTNVKYRLKNEFINFDTRKISSEKDNFKIGSSIFAVINKKDIIYLNK